MNQHVKVQVNLAMCSWAIDHVTNFPANFSRGINFVAPPQCAEFGSSIKVEFAERKSSCTCKIESAYRLARVILWYLAFTFAIRRRPSVYLSSVCLSVTLVHPTQAIEMFGNVSTPFGTLAICWHPGKILRRSSQGNPCVGGVKH